MPGGEREEGGRRERKAKCCNGPMRGEGQPACNYPPTSPTFLTHANTYTRNLTHNLTHAQAFPSCGDGERRMEFRAAPVMHSHIFYASVIFRTHQTNRNTHSVTPQSNCVLQASISELNINNILPSHLVDLLHTYRNSNGGIT